MASGAGYTTGVWPVSQGEKDLAAGAETTIDIVLEPAGSISGHVTDDRGGDPAVGMIVRAGRIESDRPEMMNFVRSGAPGARVGRDGAYVLIGLKPGEYRVVARTADSGFVSTPSSKSPRVVLEAGVDQTEVNLRVGRGGRLHGVVTLSDGKPCAG